MPSFSIPMILRASKAIRPGPSSIPESWRRKAGRKARATGAGLLTSCPLPANHAAIDVEGLAGDPMRFFRGQEGNRRDDVFRHGAPLDGLQHVDEVEGILVRCLLDTLGVGKT